MQVRPPPAGSLPPPPVQSKTIKVQASKGVTEATLRDIVDVSSESSVLYIPGSLRTIDSRTGQLEFQIRGKGLSGEVRYFDQIEPMIRLMIESTAGAPDSPAPAFGGAAIVEEPPRVHRMISEPRYISTDVNLKPDVSSSLLRREDRFKLYVSEQYGIAGYLMKDNRSFFVASAVPECFEIFESWIKSLTPEEVNRLIPSYVETIDITSVAGIIIGKGGSVLEWLQRMHGVYCPQIRSKPPGDTSPTLLRAEAYNKMALDIFVHEIKQIIDDRGTVFRQKLKDMQEKHVHIFVDVSNILYGAQQEPGGGRDLSIRLSPKKTVELVRNLRTSTPDSNIVVGSNPPPTHTVWKVSTWHDIKAKYLYYFLRRF